MTEPTPRPPRTRLAPGKLTEQFVLMEEGPTADRIKAAATLIGVSFAEVIRQCVDHGPLTNVVKRHGLNADEYAAMVDAWCNHRENPTTARPAMPVSDE